MMLTWRSMTGAEAEPPSVQWSVSVSFGVVMEIAKLIVPLICITLTVYGLYQNRCRPRASSSPDSSTPPPTEAMG
jgi:hypothetical protein